MFNTLYSLTNICVSLCAPSFSRLHRVSLPVPLSSTALHLPVRAADLCVDEDGGCFHAPLWGCVRFADRKWPPTDAADSQTISLQRREMRLSMVSLHGPPAFLSSWFCEDANLVSYIFLMHRVSSCEASPADTAAGSPLNLCQPQTSQSVM